MKPSFAKEPENEQLLDLGRATAQITHDIRNQLNGLKLYATFLRRRMAKNQSPTDEQETVAKLITGLERAASDLTTLVEYSRPVALRKQSGVELQKLMRAVIAGLHQGTPTTGPLPGLILVETDSGPLTGDFDGPRLIEAFRAISLGVVNPATTREGTRPIRVTMRRETDKGQPVAVIEWHDGTLEQVNPVTASRGTSGIKLALSDRVVEAHGGATRHTGNMVRVVLPLSR
jgi:two-component system, NtrC family, sensor kinase